MELSFDPLKMTVSSGEKQTEFTPLEWPSKLFSKAPEILSQNLMQLSFDPLKIRLISGEKQTEFTPLEWPSKLFNKVPEILSIP